MVEGPTHFWIVSDASEPALSTSDLDLFAGLLRGRSSSDLFPEDPIQALSRRGKANRASRGVACIPFGGIPPTIPSSSKPTEGKYDWTLQLTRKASSGSESPNHPLQRVYGSSTGLCPDRSPVPGVLRSSPPSSSSTSPAAQIRPSRAHLKRTLPALGCWRRGRRAFLGSFFLGGMLGASEVREAILQR